MRRTKRLCVCFELLKVLCGSFRKLLGSIVAAAAVLPDLKIQNDKSIQKARDNAKQSKTGESLLNNSSLAIH